MLWAIPLAGVFLVTQAACMVVFVSVNNPEATEDKLEQLFLASQSDGDAFALMTVITAFVCIPILLGVAKLKRGSRLLSYFAMNVVTPKTSAAWLAALLAVTVVIDVTTVLLGRPIVPEFMTTLYASADRVWLLWFALLVAAPLVEELFFRGFLFKGLEQLGAGLAVVITAASWASIHGQYDLYGIAIIFVCGVLLGAARARTNSIFLPLVMHALINLIAIAEASFLAHGA